MDRSIAPVIVELEIQAQEFDPILALNITTKSDILRVLDTWATMFQHLHLDEPSYYALLQSIIEKRHATGVRIESAYYYFYKCAGDKITQMKSHLVHKIGKSIAESVPPQTNTSTKKTTTAISSSNISQVFPILEEEVDLVEENLGYMYEDGDSKPSQGTIAPKKTRRTKMEMLQTSPKVPKDPKLQALHAERKTQKSHFEKSYEHSMYQDLFAFITHLHDTHLVAFDPVDQRKIQKMIALIQACQGKTPVQIRAFLQSKQIHLYRETREILRQIGE